MCVCVCVCVCVGPCVKRNVNNLVLDIFPRPEWKEATTCRGSRIFRSTIIWSILDPDAPPPTSLPPSSPLLAHEVNNGL